MRRREAEGSRSRNLWRSLVAVAAAALLAACGAQPPAAPPPAAVPPTGAVVDRPEPAPAMPESARLGRAAMLRDAPGGDMVGRVDEQTEFDGPTVLAVADRAPGWLGVRAPQRPNGEVAWIPEDAARIERQPYRLRADLSEREVTMIDTRTGKVELRVPVAVGRPENPTPTGEFGVTDRLTPEGGTGPYGCCILALSGRQTDLPQGWGGGDRLALHGTGIEASIGQAASSGCLRAANASMRRLMERIPLGAPVTIVR